jgi:hypothetical protein
MTKLTQQLAELNKKINKINKTKNQMADIVWHDVDQKHHRTWNQLANNIKELQNLTSRLVQDAASEPNEMSDALTGPFDITKATSQNVVSVVNGETRRVYDYAIYDLGGDVKQIVAVIDFAGNKKLMVFDASGKCFGFQNINLKLKHYAMVFDLYKHTQLEKYAAFTYPPANDHYWQFVKRIQVKV